MKLLGLEGRIRAIEIVREGFRFPPEYQAGFRQQPAGRGDGFRAVAVYVGASILVSQQHSNVLGLVAEELRCHIGGKLEPLPTFEYGSFGSVWNWHGGKSPLKPGKRCLERGHGGWKEKKAACGNPGRARVDR